MKEDAATPAAVARMPRRVRIIVGCLLAVGCDRGGGWTVELTAERGSGGDTYAPASGAALQSVDAYLDALGASDPLTADEEAGIQRRE